MKKIIFAILLTFLITGCDFLFDEDEDSNIITETTLSSSQVTSNPLDGSSSQTSSDGFDELEDLEDSKKLKLSEENYQEASLSAIGAGYIMNKYFKNILSLDTFLHPRCANGTSAEKITINGKDIYRFNDCLVLNNELNTQVIYSGEAVVEDNNAYINNLDITIVDLIDLKISKATLVDNGSNKYINDLNLIASFDSKVIEVYDFEYNYLDIAKGWVKSSCLDGYVYIDGKVDYNENSAVLDLKLSSLDSNITIKNQEDKLELVFNNISKSYLDQNIVLNPIENICIK